MEHNPCWDQNYPDGGPTYQKTLRQILQPYGKLQQLDWIFFDFEKELWDDYYGAIFQYRDDTVKGIRKVGPSKFNTDVDGASGTAES